MRGLGSNETEVGSIQASRHTPHKAFGNCWHTWVDTRDEHVYPGDCWGYKTHLSMSCSILGNRKKGLGGKAYMIESGDFGPLPCEAPHYKTKPRVSNFP